MADDEMTPRERRAQRRGGPGSDSTAARRLKAAKLPIVLILVVGSAAALVWYLNASAPTCPDHWHGTQAVFVPDGTHAGEFDNYRRIDWASPVAPNGQVYYNFGTASGMSITLHMHQTGAERGEASHGPSQFHFEGGKCVGIQNAYKIIDLRVEGDSIAVAQNTPLAAANPGGPWRVEGNHTMNFWMQSQDADGQWAWSQRDLGDYLHYQMKNGEAMVIAVGHYSESQIQAMQAQVPPPSGRPYVPPPTATDTSTSMATNSTKT